MKFPSWNRRLRDRIAEGQPARPNTSPVECSRPNLKFSCGRAHGSQYWLVKASLGASERLAPPPWNSVPSMISARLAAPTNATR